MAEKVLEISGLKTQFFTQDGLVNAVDGISFEVAKGEMVGLVGESGCGKSTTALSIMRLLPRQGKITDGKIVLNGTDLVKLPENTMRLSRGSEVAMIFQDSLAALDPTMRVGKQLIEPLTIHKKLRRDAAAKEAIELLHKVGIPDPEARMKAYPHEFSGGMRQRVMIAMALSCDPSLLLADEPTTALDVTIQRQILELMSNLKNELDAGIIVVTHDVGVVAETCDRVIVMYAGKIVEQGITEDVFTNPKHPYTQGLLGSSLDLLRDREKDLQAIGGIPPDLIELPPGCYFWPRCSQAIDVCKKETPELVHYSQEHYCACHVVEAELETKR